MAIFLLRWRQDGDELVLEKEGDGGDGDDNDGQPKRPGSLCESEDYKVREEASLRSAFLGDRPPLHHLSYHRAGYQEAATTASLVST